MFCSKCGAGVSNESAFCPNCGNTVRQQAQNGQASQQQSQAAPTGEHLVQTPVVNAAPTAVAQPNPMWKNLLSQLKAFFSSKPTKGMDLAAASKLLEWIVYLGAYFVILVLSLAINLSGLFKGMYFYGGPNFGKCLLLSLAVPVLAEGIVFGATWFYIAVVQKNKMHIMSVLNIVGYAFVPMILAALCNMVFCLIWTPLVIAAYVIAISARSMLLYHAVRESGKGKPFPQMIHFAVFAGMEFLITILVYVVIYYGL